MIEVKDLTRVYQVGPHRLTALDHVPQGARLLTMVGRTCHDEWLYSREEHIAGIALERKLLGLPHCPQEVG